MRKIYNCLNCGKWFEKAKKIKFKQVGEVGVCPFCERPEYIRVKGIKRALVCLWWWLKELFLSGGSSGTARW